MDKVCLINHCKYLENVTSEISYVKKKNVGVVEKTEDKGSPGEENNM